ncbi:MAG: gas vesicle protein GvpG [Candidatus Omnitrophica bacterium]|nr:gas vesicle protein GvpG [Candidatus Omnitrophota bacterium]
MALIIDDILLSPLKFTIWIAKKLKESAYQELTDESRVHEELLNLQMRYEVGEVSEETYEKEEEKLMERLEAIRKMKEEEI